MKFSCNIALLIGVFTLSFCRRQADTEALKEKVEYIETRFEVVSFRQPVPLRINQIGDIAKGTKLLKLQHLANKFDREPLDWTKVKYKGEEVWILSEYTDLPPAPNTEEEPDSEAKANQVFVPPREFSFDQKRVLRIALREIRELEKSEAKSDQGNANDYLNLKKPIFASVVNVDEEKVRHFAILVFFDSLSGSTNTQYVVIEKRGNIYESFGWGASIESKHEKVHEVRTDDGYFMPVD